ncbi:hypothetical protein VTK56DRAFT_9943 [Thermocarpiscus australiensis]
MLLLLLLLLIQFFMNQAVYVSSDAGPLLFPRRNGPHPVRQVRDVLVPALPAELVQRLLQLPQVVPVQAAGPLAAVDVLCQLLRVLRPDELLVVGRADVDERLEGPVLREDLRVDARRRVEGCVVDRVAVDLADVEVLFHFGDPLRGDAVGDAPHLVGCRVVVVGQLLPVGALDEGHDAPGGFGRAAVVLAVSWGGREMC